MNINLVMFKSDGTRRDFPIGKPHVVLGRTNRCDLRIPLASVSRKHCEIEVGETTVTIRDLGSSNGTYHNNERIQEAQLTAGDRITIGPVVFTVVVDGEPQNIEPVRTVVDADGSDETPLDPPDAEMTEMQMDDPIAALDELAGDGLNESDASDEFTALMEGDDEESEEQEEEQEPTHS
jgi:pSer/pThr/pTyr-binding forkhead associated (FHA) protein